MHIIYRNIHIYKEICIEIMKKNHQILQYSYQQKNTNISKFTKYI